MPNPTRIEINCETQEVLEIELTDAEVAEMTYAAELEAEAKAEADRVAADLQAQKAAVFAKLGLTADEVAALLA